MSESKRPLKVFLCHASLDKPKVRELYLYLRRRGIKPWFDEVDLVGGQDWQVEIPKALATSDAIIICLTKNSVDKEGYIQKEIKFALDKALEMPEGRIFLIPVRLEECDVPFSLSRYQWVDWFDEAGYTKIMKALKFRAAQLERATVELPQKVIAEEKLAIDKATREKIERVSAEQATREEAEPQKTTKAVFEKLEREAAEKARKELAEREAVERATQQKAKRESAERVKQEKTAHQANQIVALKETLSKSFISLRLALPKLIPFLRIGGILGIIFILFWFGSWAMNQLLPHVPAARVSVTHVSTATITASDASTHLTKTVKPTATLTSGTPPPAATATLAVVSNAPSATPILAGSNPVSYTLQEGEFAYCIARRFNVDPDGLFRASGLSEGVLYPPGTVLSIPSGPAFPGERMLKNHPTTYTVSSSYETVYSIACLFGNIEPSAIAQTNGISADASLTAGQNLIIP